MGMMKRVILRFFSFLFYKRLHLKFDSKIDVEVVVYEFEYNYNGNEIANTKIKKLVKWHDRKFFDSLFNALKISNKNLAKFLPNYIIEITQEGKILFSILTNKHYFNCGGATYKSLIDIDKCIKSLILTSE
jgi:hypothetical protein